MRRAMLLIAAMAGVCLPLPMVAQTAPTAAELAQRDVQRYVMILNLSSTQQEEALTIFTAEETTETSLRSTEHTQQKALLAAIEANETATIATVTATLGGLHGQDLLARSTASAALYALLDSTQQAKFAQILAMGDMGGNGRGGPPPMR